jgi:hypothetical protein
MWDFEDLTVSCKRWLASEVERTLDALVTSPAHEAWLEKHLDNLFWYWSVDRMKRGKVCRDALAQGGGEGAVFASQQWHTSRARAAHQGVRSKLIRRDHVVPKKILSTILREGGNAEVITQLLERYCFVVLIHADEDAKFNEAGFRQRMPPGWEEQSLLERDPWARYRAIGLDTEVNPRIPASSP